MNATFELISLTKVEVSVQSYGINFINYDFLNMLGFFLSEK